MKLNKGNMLLVLGTMAALGLMFAEPSFAGTDTKFGSATVAGPVKTLMDWLSGSLGVLISIIALAVAVISAIGGKLIGVATAIGVAIAIQVGPAVLAGMFTAALPIII